MVANRPSTPVAPADTDLGDQAMRRRLNPPGRTPALLYIVI